jgi:FMN phosphatase YigB (HAD superfamily)
VAGCDATEALHVGDSRANDVEGAERAGIRAVLLDRAGAWPDVPGSIASLADLPGLL